MSNEAREAALALYVDVLVGMEVIESLLAEIGSIPQLRRVHVRNLEAVRARMGIARANAALAAGEVKIESDGIRRDPAHSTR